MTAVNVSTFTEVLNTSAGVYPKITLVITGTLTGIIVQGQRDTSEGWVTIADEQPDFTNLSTPVKWVSGSRTIVGAADTTVSFRVDASGFATIRVLCAGTSGVLASVNDPVVNGVQFAAPDYGGIQSPQGYIPLDGSAAPSAGATTYTYDTAGRISTVSEVRAAATLARTYGYSGTNVLSTIQYNNGVQLVTKTLGYDAAGRINTATVV